jgi:hypothetical protein
MESSRVAWVSSTAAAVLIVVAASYPVAASVDRPRLVLSAGHVLQAYTYSADAYWGWPLDSRRIRRAR